MDRCRTVTQSTTTTTARQSESKQVSGQKDCEKDSSPSVGEQNGGMKERERRRGVGYGGGK